MHGSCPSPLWGGWHIVSAAKDVTGGGRARGCANMSSADGAPRPTGLRPATQERASLVSTPQGGGIGLSCYSGLCAPRDAATSPLQKPARGNVRQASHRPVVNIGPGLIRRLTVTRHGQHLPDILRRRCATTAAPSDGRSRASACHRRRAGRRSCPSIAANQRDAKRPPRQAPLRRGSRR